MDFRKNILGWQWFRDFFNITIFKYFVTWFAIVPILAKLTQHLPSKIIIPLSTVNIYTINLGLPFKWQILWFSSLCFVFAYILYIVFCPKFITKYFSLKYYKEFEHSPRWIIWEAQELVKSNTDLDKFVKRMIKKKYIENSEDSIIKDNYVDVGEKQTNLYFKFNNQKYKFSMPIIENHIENKESTEIAVREIFWEIFARFSSSKILIRSIIELLLIISLVLFAITFIQSILSGFQYFIK